MASDRFGNGQEYVPGTLFRVDSPAGRYILQQRAAEEARQRMMEGGPNVVPRQVGDTPPPYADPAQGPIEREQPKADGGVNPLLEWLGNFKGGGAMPGKPPEQGPVQYGGWLGGMGFGGGAPALPSLADESERIPEEYKKYVPNPNRVPAPEFNPDRKSQERLGQGESGKGDRLQIGIENDRKEDEDLEYNRLLERYQRYQDMIENTIGKPNYSPYPMPDEATEKGRMKNLAMLQVFAGMMEGAGGDFAPIGRGFSKAGGVYEEGFDRYQKALYGKAAYENKIAESEYSQKADLLSGLLSSQQAEKEALLKKREENDANKRSLLLDERKEQMGIAKEMIKSEDPETRNRGIEMLRSLGVGIPDPIIDVTRP